jgi:hypothetical protein
MDFIIGIIFVLVIIFIMINYTSISISNNNNNLKDINYLYTNKHNMSVTNTIPLPRQQNTSINKKLNIEEQSYDYKSYFYI